MRICIFLLLLCIPLYGKTQKTDSLRIYGIEILDGFYEKSVRNARVSVMEEDSVTLLVDSLSEIRGDDESWSAYYGTIPRREQIVLRAQHEGYGTDYLKIDIPTLTDGKLTEKLQVTKAIYLWEDLGNELGEANVTASRILMVTRGDTIEYNAAAFRLHEGSMLDNLIRALPGVLLDDDGRITVNGEYVSSLLVNGRDFFNGDPKIALRNMPAYTVKKIKVYHNSDKRRFMKDEGLDELEKRQMPLVMDVALKRDYAEGWISNYETGGGAALNSPSDARWIGRLFALRYTNHSSLGIYAGANNLNDDNAPGSKGEWKRINASNGEKKTYMAGINLSIDPKDTDIKFNTSLHAQRQESIYESLSHSTDYYESGNTYRESSWHNKDKSTSLRWNTSLNADDKLGYYSFTHSLRYTHSKVSDKSSSITLQETGMDIDTLYTRTSETNARSTQWGTALKLSRFFHTQRSGDFTLQATFDYNRTPTTNRTELDSISYKSQPANNLSEMRRYMLPASDYNYTFHVEYEKKHAISKKIELKTQLGYEYGQQFRSGHQNKEDSNGNFLTPSSAVIWEIDAQNSFHTTRMKRTHSFFPQLTFKYKKSGIVLYHLYLSLPLDLVSRRICDHRNNFFQTATDDNALLSPSATITWTKGDMKGVQMFSINASLRHTLPDIYYLLNVRDESNPLLLYEGNSSLLTTRRQSFSIGYNKENWTNNKKIDLGAGYDKWDNSVGMARLYDRQTGITTLRPYNINGNWQTYAKFTFNSFIAKDNKWNISNTARFDFAHSTDFSSDRTDETLRTSSVDNLSLTDNMRLDYRVKSLRLSGKVDVKWTRLTSCQNLFSRLSYIDFNYGFSLATPLLWDFNLGTDFMVYSRRGYYDHTMNTTDWVWNMELSRTLGRRKQWTIKAIGFDLLGQLSNVRRTINAQGRTETLYNTISSYATLHIVYRLDIKPKKK